MKIGIDIDDTISHTNELLIKEALYFDSEHLNDRGFKDETAYAFNEMFYWNSDDVEKFFDYLRNSNLFLRIEPVKDAVKYINMLKEEGNKIYFITKRNNTLKIKNMTKKWLKKNGFKYDKVYFYIKDKSEFCIKNNIDILIDNDVPTAKKNIELNLDYVLKQDDYNKDKTKYNLINDWKDIYNYINKKVE